MIGDTKVDFNGMAQTVISLQNALLFVRSSFPADEFETISMAMKSIFHLKTEGAAICLLVRDQRIIIESGICVIEGHLQTQNLFLQQITIDGEIFKG